MRAGQFDPFAHGYAIIEPLGTNPEGGRTTYLAEDRLGQRVVLKRFAFAAVDASWSGYREHEREIAVLRELTHPRVPRYLDAFETPDGFCLVQEYLDVRPLSARTSFEPEEVKTIALSVLDILVVLQRRLPPIIHRDLKPQNILVNERGEAFLVDFGLARPTSRGASTLAVGTPGFMAPEQLLGREIDERTDLFGLGATLISMLSGTPADEISELIDSSMRFDHSRLPAGLSPAFRRWLEAMVAPNRDDRHANAATAREALLGIEVVAPTPATTHATTAATRARKPSSGVRWRQWGTLALFFIGPLGALFTLHNPIDWWWDAFSPPWMTTSSFPLRVDVDGDGDEELVYVSGNLDEDAELVALTTPEHDVLWKHDVIGGQLFLAPGAIGLWHESQLNVYDVDDGERRWSQHLPDDIDEIYADADTLWVSCTDESRRLLDLQSGQRSEAPPEPPAGMTELVGNWFERTSDWNETRAHRWSENWPGLSLRRPYCRPRDRRRDAATHSCAASDGVGYAIKSPGSPTSYLVGFERPSGELRWKFQLFEPGEGALLTNDHLVVGLDDEHAYVLTRPDDSWDVDFAMWALAIDDGTIAWHVERVSERRIDQIVVTEELLYLLSGSHQALVLDKANGERVRF